MPADTFRETGKIFHMFGIGYLAAKDAFFNQYSWLILL